MKVSSVWKLAATRVCGMTMGFVLLGLSLDEARSQPRIPVEMVNKATGESSVHFPKRILFYTLYPGSAKPQRFSEMGNGGEMGGGYGGMGGMPGADGMGSGMAGPGMGAGMGSGMGGMGGMNGGMGGPGMGMGMGMDGQMGSIQLYALVENANRPARANIQIAVSTPVVQEPVEPGADGGMGMMGSEAPLRLTLIQDADWLVKALPKTKMAQHSPTELLAVAQLVRLDIWIEDTQKALRSNGSDAESTAIESELRKLLTEEYEQQLAKQTEDIARLRQRLEYLQSELERRAKAKNRVIDVQLGKMVLESQGLLRP